MLHNEVFLVGRLMNRGSKVRINNREALCLVLAVPNDEDYNQNPNKIAVNYYTDDYKMFYGMIGESFVINGHIETKYGNKIICDSLFLLKTSTNC